MLKKLLSIKLIFFEIWKQEIRVELSGKSWDDSWVKMEQRLIYRHYKKKRDNTFAFTDYEKAEELNSHFAFISTVNDVNTEIPKSENRCNVDFTQITISKSEVADILKILLIKQQARTALAIEC